MTANAGRRAARLMLRPAVPAAASRPPTLRPRFDLPLDFSSKYRPRVATFQDATPEPKVRSVLPLEVRHDAEKDVVILCRLGRAYFIHYATGATGLLHSDLIKYWVEDSVREIYTDILTQRRGVAAASADQGEFGKDMDATLQAFQKFGSALSYELGTTCVRDENGALRVVMDEGFVGAFSDVLPYPPGLVHPTGYALWTVPKAAFQIGAFKVERIKKYRLDIEYVVADEWKLRALMPGASNEEVMCSLQVKTAVEIDRSVLRKGRLLLFMPPRSAWNKFEVFAEMRIAGDDDLTGLELELTQYDFLRDRHKYTVSYTLRRQNSEPFESASDDE